MGNFDNLKTAITEVIRQNGNEEITGDVLQFVLLEMVSGLGAGYRFLGVCTPETEPEEPDGAAFYVGGAGEYSNFDGIAPTVEAGYICFFKWDGAEWSYSPLKVTQAVDQEITEGGENPVTGGAIYDEFQKLRQAGYLFAGVAFPATDPGEVTEKVFYLATQAGNYQNFGSGILLPWGVNILKYNGSIWTGTIVVEITDLLSADSRALVTSGGVFTAMAGKVDTEAGKGLSEADFTNAEKGKLSDLPTAAELAALFDGKQDVLQFDGAPTPDSQHPVTSEGIYDAIKDFITKSVSDLLYYYTKSDTFNKTEVLNLIAAVKQFRYEVVEELPEASIDTVGVIYFVPSGDPQTSNVKDEYITLTKTEGGATVYYWEKIGSTEIDLSNYATFDDVNAAIATALADYYTKQEIAAIIAAEEGKLADLSIETSKEVIQTGQSTSVMVTVRSTIEASEIVMKRNGVVVMQGAGKSLQFNDVLEEAQSGNVTYLAVLTIGGTERTIELQLPVIDPVYYGAALQASDVTTKATARKSPEGRYTVTAAEDESYIFILVPMSMTVNGVEMSGIEMPMEAATGIVVGSLAYKCYQSSNTYDAGVYNINVF